MNPNFRWYVVHTYSGYENRAKKSLEERIKQAEELEEFFGEVLIPTENVVELGKGGQKKTSKRKFFPGYMLVQMELKDESWHLVKSTPKITGFVGSATRPPSIPETASGSPTISPRRTGPRTPASSLAAAPASTSPAPSDSRSGTARNGRSRATTSPPASATPYSATSTRRRLSSMPTLSAPAVAIGIADKLAACRYEVLKLVCRVLADLGGVVADFVVSGRSPAMCPVLPGRTKDIVALVRKRLRAWKVG